MNKIQKIIICAPLLLILFGLLMPITIPITLAPTAHAQVKLNQDYIKDIPIPLKDVVEIKNNGTPKDQPAGAKGINYLLQKIASGLIYIAAPLAVLFVVNAGVSYTMATGDTNKTDAAKKELIWTVLGLLIILTAIVAIRMLIGFLFFAPE